MSYKNNLNVQRRRLKRALQQLKDNSDNESSKVAKETFKYPKLPFVQLGVTFVLPVLTVVLPYYFAAAQDSLQTLITIGLILLAVLLFVLFLTTFVHMYNSEYKQQATDLRMDYLNDRITRIQKDAIDLVNEALDTVENAIAQSDVDSNHTESPQE